MTFDEAKDQIAMSLDMDCMEKWFSILDNSNPGHYGVEDLSFQVAPRDIWIDFPTKTFSFKNATLSFSARLGSSREEDGADMNFRQPVAGQGRFRFVNSRKLEVTEFEIDENIPTLELFGVGR